MFLFKVTPAAMVHFQVVITLYKYF